MRVVLREEESFDSLLQRFRKGVVRASILSAVKKKRYYVSNSEKRRAARRKGLRKEQKRQQRLNRYSGRAW